MPPVAVGERVNPDQVAVKARCDFIGGKRGVVDPPAGVPEQLRKLDAHLCPVAADVLVRLAKRARPRPGFAEHLFMQRPAELLAEDVR
ncbi:hypothetical protein D9M68_934550 [compost metagenome]